MDPANPASFNHRTEILSTGRSYHFVDQVPDGYDPKRTPTLLLVHGFPDLWYGWRYQIRPWVKRGWRVVAPDMLGYGSSAQPSDPAEYSTKKLCSDLSALLDLLSVKRAVLIGHDWGSYTVGRFALWYPHRLLALVIISVAYTPPTRTYVSIEDVAKLAPNLTYQAYFNSQKSTKELERNIPRLLSLVYAGPDRPAVGSASWKVADMLSDSEVGPSILNAQELGYYISQFKLGGLNGPLNYYRTAKYRHDEELAANLSPHLREDLPVLFLWGTLDTTAVPSVHRKAHKFVPRLQELAFEGKGHWLLVEAKEDVANKVASWLEDLSASSRARVGTKL